MSATEVEPLWLQQSFSRSLGLPQPTLCRPPLGLHRPSDSLLVYRSLLYAVDLYAYIVFQTVSWSTTAYFMSSTSRPTSSFRQSLGLPQPTLCRPPLGLHRPSDSLLVYHSLLYVVHL